MKRILEFEKTECRSCLVCGKEMGDNISTIEITRLQRRDSIITFGICTDCLRQMVKDIEEYLK